MKLFRTIETAADGHFCVGDKIAFTLNTGEKVEALAVKQEGDGMVFYFVDTLAEEFYMNRGRSNCGGYAASDLRKILNGEIRGRFPADIRGMLIPFENGDYLRLATEREIFGKNDVGEYEAKSVQQWEPMKDRRNRIAFQGSKTGILGWYWLQNADRDSAAAFAYVRGTGHAACYDASYSLGVRPAFKIGNHATLCGVEKRTEA